MQMTIDGRDCTSETWRAHFVVLMLDGLDGVERLTGVESRTSIHNWLSFGQFPARFYKVMTDALRREGFDPDKLPLELWGQRGNHELNRS